MEAMTNHTYVAETREALAHAQRRLALAQAELQRHLQHEPNEPHAAERHAHTERKLRADISLAECDVDLLGRELSRAIERSLHALREETYA
jgi:hypothetical protein